MTSLCDLATRLPPLIAGLLDQEAKLKRGRFREETLTDIFTGALVAFAGPDLVIEYPNEPATGGDVDMEFWHVKSGRWLRLRLQAKRLNAAKQNGKDVKTKHRAYKELLHKVPGTGVYQFRTLVYSASSYLPLYMFYNHGSVMQAPEFSAKIPTVRGINLAFATDVARLLEDELAGKPKRLNHKRLSHLRPYFFELADIFCASANAGENIPSPDAVSESLLGALPKMAARDEPRPDDERVLRLMMGPLHRDSLGHAGRQIADGPAIRVNPELKRPAITFISGKTEDKRTPKIS